MSTTTTTQTPEVIATDQAVAAAKDAGELLSTLETANPALYAQLFGSLATYGKSAAAPLVGSLLGALVAHYGLGPYVTADTLNLATEALVGVGTGAGAIVMHWISKKPARALQTPTTQGTTP